MSSSKNSSSRNSSRDDDSSAAGSDDNNDMNEHNHLMNPDEQINSNSNTSGIEENTTQEETCGDEEEDEEDEEQSIENIHKYCQNYIIDSKHHHSLFKSNTSTSEANNTSICNKKSTCQKFFVESLIESSSTKNNFKSCVAKNYSYNEINSSNVIANPNPVQPSLIHHACPSSTHLPHHHANHHSHHHLYTRPYSYLESPPAQLPHAYPEQFYNNQISQRQSSYLYQQQTPQVMVQPQLPGGVNNPAQPTEYVSIRYFAPVQKINQQNGIIEAPNAATLLRGQQIFNIDSNRYILTPPGYNGANAYQPPKSYALDSSHHLSMHERPISSLWNLTGGDSNNTSTLNRNTSNINPNNNGNTTSTTGSSKKNKRNQNSKKSNDANSLNNFNSNPNAQMGMSDQFNSSITAGMPPFYGIRRGGVPTNYSEFLDLPPKDDEFRRFLKIGFITAFVSILIVAIVVGSVLGATLSTQSTNSTAKISERNLLINGIATNQSLSNDSSLVSAQPFTKITPTTLLTTLKLEIIALPKIESKLLAANQTKSTNSTMVPKTTKKIVKKPAVKKPQSPKNKTIKAKAPKKVKTTTKKLNLNQTALNATKQAVSGLKSLVISPKQVNSSSQVVDGELNENADLDDEGEDEEWEDSEEIDERRIKLLTTPNTTTKLANTSTQELNPLIITMKTSTMITPLKELEILFTTSETQTKSQPLKIDLTTTKLVASTTSPIVPYKTTKLVSTTLSTPELIITNSFKGN